MNGYTDLPTNMENSRNCLRRIARHDDQEFSNQSILNAMETFVKTVNMMDETILVPCRLMDRKVGDATDTVPVAPKAQHHGAHHGKKSNRTSIREVLNTAELFQIYNMLKIVKVDLLWGRQDAEDNMEESVVMGSTKSTSSKVNSNNTDTNVTNSSATSSTSSNTTSDVTMNTNNSTGSSVAGSEKVEANSSISPATTTATSVKGHIRRPSTVSVASSNSASTLSDSDSETSAENDSGIESEGNQEQDRSAELAKQFRMHLIGLYRSLEQMSEAANYLTARYQSDVGPV
ncbi:osteocalcin 2 [Anopheles arabiensis]|uniref:AGAP004837-PA n=3 Tax=gambiae species complex TaxID=44542 RepID=Q5TSK7_ANOGA|nr:osteocalcin 2 [Anopheles arabiensis]XP_040218484.1 osteocalcin 2 [Anopheles coluzzii]XP_558285.3 osteocalcin 2 [Anopheles gambiae]EAL40412.3 AGAP004837-PA [Anopheles gambiae str. PEST]